MAQEVQKLQTTLEVVADADKAKRSLDELASKLDKDVKGAAERQAKDIDKLNATIEQNARKAIAARQQIVSGVATVFGGLNAALGDADDTMTKFLGRGKSIILMANQWGQVTNSILQAGQALRDVRAAQAATQAAQLALAGKGGGQQAGGGGDSFQGGVAGGLLANSGIVSKAIGGAVAVGKGTVAAVGAALSSTVGAVVSAAAVAIGGSVWARYAPQKQIDAVAKWIFSWWNDLGEKAVKQAEQRAQASVVTEQARRLSATRYGEDLAASTAARGQVAGYDRQLQDVVENFYAAGRKGRDGKQLAGAEKDVYLLDIQRKQVAKEILALNTQQAQAQKNTEEEGKYVLGDRIKELDILKQQREAHERAVALERQRNALLIQQQQQARQSLEVAKNLSSQWVDANRQALEAQKARIQAAKEEYGLSNAQDRDAIKQVAQQIKEQGLGSLSRRQLDFAKSHQGIFGQYLSEQAPRRAEAAGFQDIAQILGLTTDRQRAALAQAQAIEVTVKRVFDAKVEFDTKVAARELAQALGPLFAELKAITVREAEVQAKVRESDRGFQQRQIDAKARSGG